MEIVLVIAVKFGERLASFQPHGNLPHAKDLLYKEHNCTLKEVRVKSEYLLAFIVIFLVIIVMLLSSSSSLSSSLLLSLSSSFGFVGASGKCFTAFSGVLSGFMVSNR